MGGGLRRGDDREHAAHSIRAVDGGAAAAPDLHPIHPEHRERGEKRGRVRLGRRGVPERHPVHDHRGGLGREATEAKGELLALASGLVHERAGHSAEPFQQEPPVPLPEGIGG
ncbi:MAG: hypothetical protein OXE58_03275, partial [Acidobacteria bacterium]|nr:hypothetical protein [Acidobacteriota bacterium]